MAIIEHLEKTVDYYFACLPRSKPSKNIEAIKLIAHRGAHSVHQGIIENTHLAFTRAEELGCWGIEFDIHATADGIFVVNHDPTLHRLWNKNHHIQELSFQELRRQAPEIPSLQEVIERYGKKMHLFIEIKNCLNDETALVHSLQGLTAGDDYHLLSLGEPIFQQMRHFPRHSLLLVAGHNNVGGFCTASIDQQYGGVLGHYLLLTNKKIKHLHQANQRTGVGFIDSKYSLYREVHRGIQWIFTNNAERVSNALQALRSGN